MSLQNILSPYFVPIKVVVLIKVSISLVQSIQSFQLLTNRGCINLYFSYEKEHSPHYPLTPNPFLGCVQEGSFVVPAKVVSNTPTSYVGGTIQNLQVGYDSTCLQRQNGVECWGANSRGQLGNGSLDFSFTPTRVKGVDGVGYLTGIKSLQTNSYYNGRTCVVLASGKVACWGFDSTKPYPMMVKAFGGADLEDVVEAAPLQSGGCARKSDKTVWCWGDNAHGQLGNATNVTSQEAVQVVGVGGVGFLTDVKQISTSGITTCALLESTEAVCWGYGGYGAIGNNGWGSVNTPAYVRNTAGTANLSGIRSLYSVKYFSNSAVMSDGTVFTWGCGWGHFGNGNSGNYALPQQMMNPDGVTPFTDVVRGWGGYLHASVQKSSGDLYCLGGFGSHYGSNGSGSLTNSYYPVPVKNSSNTGNLAGVRDLSLGLHTTCALMSGTEVKCWGDNMSGVLGVTSTPAGYSTYPAETLSSVSDIPSRGFMAQCTLQSDSSVKCFGYNGYGEVGNNATGMAWTPATVPDPALAPLTGVTKISSYYLQACAVMSDSTAKCWGYNNLGRLGDNTTTNRSVATAVKDETGLADLTDVVEIHIGSTATYALRGDGRVSAWGKNSDYNQLGNGTAVNSPIPVYARNSTNTADLSGVSQLVAGGDHGCVVKLDKTVQCWGANNVGQLGDNTTTNRSLPVTVKDSTGTGVLSNVEQIAAGGGFTCAKTADNTMWCWGRNTSGALGNGTVVNSSLPVQVLDASGAAPLADVDEIFAGPANTCAKLYSGDLYCWGDRAYGQLMKISSTPASLPVRINSSLAGAAFTGVSKVSISNYNMCALSTSGKVHCWGQNQYGINGAGDVNRTGLPATITLPP